MTDGPPPRHLHPVGGEEPPFDPDYDRPPAPDNRGPGAAPGDRSAEAHLLATLLQHPTTADQVTAQIDGTDLYWPVHRQIWDAWHHLTDTDGVPPDAVTLNAHLVTTRQADATRVLLDLATLAPSPTLAEHYAAIVRDHARLRTVVDLGTRLTQLARTHDLAGVDAVLGEALQTVEDATMRYGPRIPTTRSTGLADLSWILTGQAPTATPPIYGVRTDDTALFYAGRHNGVFGDPESGKTWLAQVAGVEALAGGGTFAMIDVDHNGQDHTAARLLLLGAHPNHIADPERFRYYEPEDADQLHAAVTDIVARAPSVVVLDSIGEILPMLGVKSVDNDEITHALRTVVMPPAKAGSCVISVDHLPKSVEARTTGYAIGGTAKKRAVDGAYLRAEAKVNPSPGGVGRISLRIEKDRTGELRKSSNGGYAGTFVLDSTQPHTTTWTIGREQLPTNDDGTVRPTNLMEKVSKFIEDNEGCTGRDIQSGVPGKERWITDAIRILVAEGHVARQPGARRAQHHTLLIPYREAEDDRS